MAILLVFQELISVNLKLLSIERFPPETVMILENYFEVFYIIVSNIYLP